MDDVEFKNYLMKEWGNSPTQIDAGLNEDVKKWESIVESIAAGKKQHYDDYFLDVHCRSSLDRFFDLFTNEQMAKFKERIALADKKFKKNTYPLKEYFQGEKYEKEQGLNREKHWWFYYRPKNIGESTIWPAILE